MGIFNDFKKIYEEMDDEIPQFNPYDPTYIKDRIRVLKANPVRNRFKVGVAVRMTEIDERHQPINVTECYLLGELCMNRHPQFYHSCIWPLFGVAFLRLFATNSQQVAHWPQSLENCGSFGQ